MSVHYPDLLTKNCAYFDYYLLNTYIIVIHHTILSVIIDYLYKCDKYYKKYTVL